MLPIKELKDGGHAAETGKKKKTILMLMASGELHTKT